MANCWHRLGTLWKTLILLLCVIVIIGVGTTIKLNSSEDFSPAPTDPAELRKYEIEIFREYLRIPSVHPDVDYRPCVEFLKRQARSLDLPIHVYYPANKKNPMVVLTWIGSEPQLPSIVLNSHMDVVPVYADQWNHPPFAAEMDAEGRIFGRGAQDMKLVGMQYLGAIRALKISGVKQMKRTIHVIFAPNEEIGGLYGWRDFVHTNEFKSLNVGFHLDEGISSENENFVLFNAERTVFTTIFEITGESGHGSLILPNTAGQKARYVIDKMMDFRDSEENRLWANPKLRTADVTTINLTILKGGVQSNVIPRDIKLVFDVRVAIDVDLVNLKKTFEQWAKEAGGGITVTQESTFLKPSITRIDVPNQFWMAIQNAAKIVNITLEPQTCTGRTDAGFAREMNVSALGFSPIYRVPLLAHRTDEYIPADMYLRGINIYEALISELANV